MKKFNKKRFNLNDYKNNKYKIYSYQKSGYEGDFAKVYIIKRLSDSYFDFLSYVFEKDNYMTIDLWSEFLRLNSETIKIIGKVLNKDPKILANPNSFWVHPQIAMMYACNHDLYLGIKLLEIIQGK